MYLFSNNKEECCGCKVCATICPKQCISFSKDDETFVFPNRNLEQCINCHLCESICPVSVINQNDKRLPISSYVGIHKDVVIVNNSSSGGAFSAICEYLCSIGFKIYGTILNEKLQCVVEDSESIGGYSQFCKSKYIQSDTNGCFEKIKADLLLNKRVLFSGTPCQCFALKGFLKKKQIIFNENNLIYVDILCHGVPSQTLFDNYIKELEEKNDDVVLDFVFRNKKKINNIVNSRSVEVIYKRKKELHDIVSCSYLRGYHTRLFYRLSCYNCPFASATRVSDLTLGDAWGVEDIYPPLQSLKGVSLILVNTKNGENILGKINMNLLPIDLQWAISSNDTLRNSTKMHPKRNKFLKYYSKKGFTKAVKRYSIPPLYKRVINKCIRFIQR